MHSYTSIVILALALPLTWATTDPTNSSQCLCDFPNQMYGAGHLLLLGNDTHGGVLIPRGSQFAVDFSAQRARFYNSGKWYFLDYQAMKLYTFDSDPRTGETNINCTSAVIPQWMKIPSCLPAGSRLESIKPQPVYGYVDRYSHIWSTYDIGIYGRNSCKPAYLTDLRPTDTNHNITRMFVLSVGGFSIIHPEDLNPGNTSACSTVKFTL